MGVAFHRNTHGIRFMIRSKVILLAEELEISSLPKNKGEELQ